jgi:DNA-binding MarR family transcriptional regulator
VSIPCIAACAAVLLLLPILILLWATESTEQRARRLRSYGWTQRRIAEHMGISRSRVQRIVNA